MQSAANLSPEHNSHNSLIQGVYREFFAIYRESWPGVFEKQCYVRHLQGNSLRAGTGNFLQAIREEAAPPRFAMASSRLQSLHRRAMREAQWEAAEQAAEGRQRRRKKMRPLPLKPVAWPPKRWHGDKLVPTNSEGREIALFAVYVIAPSKAREPVLVGATDNLSKRLGTIRSSERGERSSLFWAGWCFSHAHAKRVARTALALLARSRKRAGRGRSGFCLAPEWAKAAILIAARKAEVRIISHERYLATCRWRKAAVKQ
jgi:hypothetical protein